RTREPMQHYAEALLSSGDFARYLADDVAMSFMGSERQIQGRDAVRRTITFVHEEAFRTAIEVKSLVCDGGHAAIEAEFVGTHVGEFEGVSPANRAARLAVGGVYDVKDDQITTFRLYFPLDALVKQIA